MPLLQQKLQEQRDTRDGRFIATKTASGKLSRPQSVCRDILHKLASLDSCCRSDTSSRCHRSQKSVSGELHLEDTLASGHGLEFFVLV